MLVAVLCFAIVWAASAGAEPTVSTKLGTVHGTIDVSTGVPVEAYLGIPFAKAPVGNRRFARPEAFGKFGDLDASKYGPLCVQSIVETETNSSEDCLHLNVFRKEKAVYSAAELPVIIIIHGGSFAFGGANAFSYSGTPLAAHAQAVVVTIQYRLGILGFAQSDTIPANLGLQDQRLAIEWVHENIASFGGSPGKVTLMGVSAGSMSVSVHVMSPELRERNLFQAVIMDAGVMSAIVASKEETIRRMQSITAKLSCPLSGPEALKCLRETNVQDLIKSSIRSEKHVCTFVPNDQENDFSPRRKNSEHFLPVRMLIGTAENEGLLFTQGRVDPSLNLQNGEEFVALCRELTEQVGVKVDVDNPSTAQLLKESYFKKHRNTRKAVAEFLGDSGFNCPGNEFIQVYSEFNDDVFVYRFDRKLAQAYPKLQLNPEGGALHWTPYVHFSGSLLSLGPFAHPSDEKFSLDSMKMISSFIRGESLSFRGVAWPPFPKTGEILIIDEQPSIKYGLHNSENCKLLLSTSTIRKPALGKQEL